MWKKTLYKLNPLQARISDLLNEGQKIGLIYIDIVDFTKIEELYGSSTCQLILKILSSSIEIRSKEVLSSSLLNIEKLGGDDFALYMHIPVTWNIPHDLAQKCKLLRKRLQTDINKEIKNSVLPQPVQLHVGFSLITPENDRSLPSKLYTALKEAVTFAKKHTDLDFYEHLVEFKQILYEKKLRTVYQPIVCLKNGKVFALEALTRGPNGSYFKSPLRLFDFAKRAGLLYTLEKVARETAISSLPSIPEGTKLFLNIDPQVFNDPTFSRGYTRKLLENKGISPWNVVFEVTERNAIEDFAAFEATVRHYRQQGFNVAVDDAGSGYSSLQSITELQPEFIKLDISLIKNIQQSKVKRTVVETMLSLAYKLGAKIIAEGIETKDELETLLQLGVEIGQGYFLARPNFPPPAVSDEAIFLCREESSKQLNKKARFTLGEITKRNITLVPTDTAETASQYFDEHPEANCLVILENKRPLGLVMRDKLYHKLATQYGIPLYWKKTITNIMDANPLILPANTPIEEAAQLAMTRQNHKLYDEIIVTEDDNYLGNVSIQHLLEAMTYLQLELARFANPLTELPGNQRIQKEINDRIQNGKIFALIYCDLDNFKAYNDFYGFEMGDQAILLVKEVLLTALNNFLSQENFLGHVGGDDFIILTGIENYERLCQFIISEWDRRVPELYDRKTRENGYILSRDRRGNQFKFPLMTISLAVVTNKYRKFDNHLKMSEVVADVKKVAKKSLKSCFFVDQRKS